MVLISPTQHNANINANLNNRKINILHHKAFRADYISRSIKICAPSAARILVRYMWYMCMVYRYKLYYKLGVEKDRASIFTTIWKPGLMHKNHFYFTHPWVQHKAFQIPTKPKA